METLEEKMKNNVQLVVRERDGTTEVKLSITRKAALESKLFQSMLVDDDDESPVIPVPNLNAEVMRKIIKFCEHHAEDPMGAIPQPITGVNMKNLVSAWDAEFIDVGLSLIFELILAANYLDLDPLLQLCCAKVATMIKGKQGQEIRQAFGITGDLTKEEDDLVRKEVGPYVEREAAAAALNDP